VLTGKNTKQMNRTYRLILAFVIMASSLPGFGVRAQGSEERQPLLATVHVHSSASTGEMTIEALAERAEQLAWMR
jgi:hypothetical protein